VGRKVLGEQGLDGIRIAAIAKGRRGSRSETSKPSGPEGRKDQDADFQPEDVMNCNQAATEDQPEVCGVGHEAEGAQDKASGNDHASSEPEEGKVTDRIFIAGRSNPVSFSKSPEGLRLLQQVRDEAHRFAVSYHRKLRSKQLEQSELNDIPGIGQKRKRALLKNMGDIEKIRQASVEELAGIEGMNEKVARQVWQHFHGKS